MMQRCLSRWITRSPVLWLVALGATGQAAGQVPSAPPYQSRFVEANGVRLQYIDFGGEGLPLIFVQDVHNIFEDETPEYRNLWTAFYGRFTDAHRVLATVRRGYGESESPNWGYDIPTQAEDLLGVMDALGIRRAVLFGRTTATQEMTWIAEHHPDRIAGLVYLGNPPIFSPRREADAARFDALYTLASCDLQERGRALIVPRNGWRPHFLADSTTRIDLPALRFHNPALDRRSMSLRRLERLKAPSGGPAQAECPGQVPFLAFADSLIQDPERRDALRRAFEAADMTAMVDDAIARAFGSSMMSIREPEDLEDWPDYFTFMLPHMRAFLAVVSQASDRRE